MVLSHLQHKMKPKELKMVLEELHLSEGTRDFLEWSLLRRWVKSSTKYVPVRDSYYYPVGILATPFFILGIAFFIKDQIRQAFLLFATG